MPEESIKKLVGEGTSNRLRAIILTSLPTPLTLVLIPCLYTIGMDIRKITGKISRRKDKAAV